MAEGVPQNAAYLAAAYIAVPAILIAYAVSLYRRSKQL